MGNAPSVPSQAGLSETLSQTGLLETPSQTAGPYVHIGLIPAQAGLEIFEKPLGATMVSDGIEGERIRIEGLVLDGLGQPVRDALLEIWQADAAGRYAGGAMVQAGPAGSAASAGFRGWGRAGTNFTTGLFAFDTIKPGAAMGRHGRMMAPHVNFWIVSRGINIGLQTRMYFGDEADANADDAVLNQIDPSRRGTLMGVQTADGYRFDIRLQGADETVFFDA